MKNILKSASLLLCLAAVLITGCEEDKVVFNGGQSMAGLASTNALDLAVLDQGEAFVEITVEVSTVSNVDRAIGFTVAPTSTATPDQYTIDQSTLKIPAGSYSGVVKINGNFDNLTETGSQLDLILSTVEGGFVSAPKSAVSINIFRLCTVTSTFLTGSYLFEEMTPFVDGPTFEDGTIREITAPDANDATKRRFTTYTYPNYCSTTRVAFNFNLVCGEITIPSGNTSNCTCVAGPFVLGAPTTNGTYDSSDDSVVYLSFTNDVTANCAPAQQTTYKLTKQ